MSESEGSAIARDKHHFRMCAARMHVGIAAKENTPPRREQELPAEPARNSMVSRGTNKQSKATVTGLVRIHSCLSPPHLRRNSKGMPSATATYTALRKIAAGGNLIPTSCQTAETSSQRHRRQNIQHDEGAMQNLCLTRLEKFLPTVGCQARQQYLCGQSMF